MTFRNQHVIARHSLKSEHHEHWSVKTTSLYKLQIPSQALNQVLFVGYARDEFAKCPFIFGQQARFDGLNGTIAEQLTYERVFPLCRRL